MNKFAPIITCGVCGIRLPHMSREQAIRTGSATIKGDGGLIYHCKGRHSIEEILVAMNANPKFQRASEYKLKKGVD